MRSRRAAALGLLTALAAAVLGAARPAAPAPERVAVVSYSSAAALRGVDVLARYAAVGVATVRGTDAELAALAGRPGVRSVSPDRVLRAANGPAAETADSVLAWERLGGAAGRPGAGTGVGIALVDTGVADTAALDRASGRLVDALDSSGEGSFADGYGHGTFMAGILAGGPVAETGARALGVAPGATVYNVKVADATGTTSLSRVVAGLDWVAAHAGQVRVASFSFAGPRPGAGYGPDPLTHAVERVLAAGVVFVVSAGNVAGEVGDPGFDPWALTVGAADVTAGRPYVAEWSGSAVVAGVPKPDLVASGVNVLSVLPESSAIALANPGARHGALWRGSGTSQATAQADGAAALFVADFPAATPAEVKAALRRAARPVHGDNSGAGLLALAHRRSGSDGGPADWSGEGAFDGGTWAANSWSANSWSANSWSANSWSANSWSANSWSANSWSRAPRDATSPEGRQ